MKKLLTTLFILLSLITLSINFSGGTGTIDDPYLISSAEQLNNIRNHMDKHFKQINDIDLSIYDNWEPIGRVVDFKHKDNIVFAGSYNGNNYIIDNLTINKPDENFVGLFRYLEDEAIIKNINLNNVNIYGYNRVGAIAGHNYSGTIKNVSVYGLIKGIKRVGGLIGSSDEKSAVLDSYSKIKVKGQALVGGIAGINNGEIINCDSDVVVHYLDDDFTEDILYFGIGGIAGRNLRNIENCASKVIIKSLFDYVDKNNDKIKSHASIGGIVGANDGTVKYCTSEGEINGNYFTGGIAGTNPSNTGSIINCKSFANIFGNTYVGGVSGYNGNLIKNSESSGNVKGEKEIGGIVGFNFNSGEIIDNISKSLVEGNVGIGGVAGTNKGKITNSKFLGEVKGNTFVGLFIGINAFNGIYDIFNESIKENYIAKDYSIEIVEKTHSELLKEYSDIWGLGKNIKKYVSNDIDIKWYETQYNTGEYANINCVPTSAAMAVNWYNRQIITNGEEARNLFLQFDIDKAWSNYIVYEYFHYYDIKFDIKEANENVKINLLDSLDDGNILLVTVAMQNISYVPGLINKTGVNTTSPEEVWYHSFIIKGYVKVEDKIYFQIYDPLTSLKNFDGTYRGKNIYYFSDEVIKGIYNEGFPIPYFVIYKD